MIESHDRSLGEHEVRLAHLEKQVEKLAGLLDDVRASQGRIEDQLGNWKWGAGMLLGLGSIIGYLLDHLEQVRKFIFGA